MPDGGRQELLILTRWQFGYLLDAYYYCKLARKQLHITYVGLDVGRPKLHLDGVDIKYVAYGRRRLRRYLRLLMTFAREIAEHKERAVFINYFLGCSVLICFGARARMTLDIRSGSVSENPLVRWCENGMMRLESRLFQSVSVVSQRLAERLHLPSGRTHVLPLGAERIMVEAKRFDRLDLLYVGTLDGRRIVDTVVGFDRFLKDYGAKVAVTYTIIGDSENGQLEQLRHMVRLIGLENIVHLPGYVHKTHLQDVYNRCNVGVSYVPINDVYDCQPVTKTFEYVFAGMPVIATATTENKRVIKRFNGVLIEDTPEGFYHGLETVYARRHEFDCEEIRHSCPESSWDRIVSLNFVPYVDDICRSRPL